MEKEVENMARKKIKKMNIFEFYSDYSKEQILNAISRLKREDRQLLQKAYKESYDDSSSFQLLSEIEQRRVKAILYYNLRNRLENPSYWIENIQSIFEKYSNHSKEEIWEAFYKLSPSQQKFLIEIYGENLDNLERVESLTPSQKVKLKRTINESLQSRLNPITRTIQVKNIFERYPDYSKEEILEAISRLSSRDQQLLHFAYGINLTDRTLFTTLSEKEKSNVKNIVSFSIKKRLENKSLVSSLQKKNSIFDYYTDYSKEKVLEAISRLPLKDQETLQEVYGTSYEESGNYEKLPSQQKEKVNDILRRQLKFRIENPQMKQTRIKNVFERYPYYSKEEILEAISKIPKQNQELLKLGFGEDYDDITNYSLLGTYERTRINKILSRKVKFFLENPEKIKRYCNDIKSYYKEYSKEEIEDAISRLTPNQRELIVTVYGTDLERIDGYYELSNQEKEQLHYILSKTLLERLENPAKKESKKGKIVQTIPERFPDKSYLERKLAIAELTSKRQEILKKAFGENFDSRENYELLNKEERRSVQVATTQLKEKIKRIEENGFYGYFSNDSKEKIIASVKELSENQQKFLQSIYGDNLDQYNNLKNLSDNELNQIEEIVQVIKTLLEKKEGKINSSNKQRKIVRKTSSKKKERKKRQPKSLKQYFSFTSIEELKSMISYLPIEDQNLLMKAYGENFDSTEKLKELSSKDMSRVYYIRLKLKSTLTGEKVKETLNPNRRMGQDAKSLLEYLKDYPLEEVMESVEKLPPEEKLLLQKSYGENFDDATCYYQLDEIEKRKVQKIKIKVKNILLGIIPEKNNVKQRKAKTLKEYFSDVSDEEIELALSFLSDEQIKLLKRAYGENYDEIKDYYSLSNQEKKKVYNIKYKMKQILSDKEMKKKRSNKKITPRKKKIIPTISKKQKQEKKKDPIIVSKERKKISEARKKYVPLSRQKELKWIKASKLSYYHEVDDKTKKEYLQYYFDIYPLRRKRYKEIISLIISLKEQIEQEYLYYTHQENGLQNHFSESINLLIKYSNELKSLEKQRSTLLEKYIEDSKEKRDHFLENNQGLIVNIAKTKTTIAPFDDLVSEGNIGMMKALEKFDVESGNKFSTYATWWIKQAISRFLKNGVRAIRIPVYKEDEILRLTRIRNQLSSKMMREPTIEELAKEVGYTNQKIEELLQELKQANQPLSLSQGITDNSDTEIISVIGVEDEAYEEIENSIYIEQFMQFLTKISLTQIEIDIISKRYGLEDGIFKTFEEISREYHVSKERIRQIELSALKKIRMNLDNDNFFTDIFPKGKVKLK